MSRSIEAGTPGRRRSSTAPLEHVDAGVDVARVDLVGRRLLDERRHLALRRRPHEAVGGRVLHRRERDGGRRAARLVARDLRADVDVGQDVAVEHQEAVVEQRLRELQRAARAERDRFLDVAQPHAERRPVAEHVAHPGREVAAAHDDVVDVVMAQPVDHEGDEGPVDERHDGLRHGRGERPQPRALPAGEDQRLHVSGTPPSARSRPRMPTATCAPRSRPADRLVGQPGGARGGGVEEVAPVDERACRASPPRRRRGRAP